jgi:peptidoglycan/LPS O-acetylase OafA/YrhL
MADYSKPERFTKRRWVRLSVILAVVLILVIVVLLLTLGDGHRPGPPPGGH